MNPYGHATNRYKASGIPEPDPQIMCKPCSGMGFAPRWVPEDPAADQLGFVFLRCDVCGGTGKNDDSGTPISDAAITVAVQKIKGAIRG